MLQSVNELMRQWKESHSRTYARSLKKLSFMSLSGLMAKRAIQSTQDAYATRTSRK